MMRLRNYHQRQHRCNSTDIEPRFITLDGYPDFDNVEESAFKISSKNSSSHYHSYCYFVKLVIIIISVLAVIALNIPSPSITINSMPSIKTTEIAKPTRKLEEPIIHIVNTRFMQEQGKLTTLAKARLHLFRTFCLPTIVHQTSQNFLWIIKTDTNLDAAVREELITLIQPYPNYFLVGSERDLNGAWRGGMEGAELLSHEENNRIYTGDVELIRAAYSASERRIVLETRLDADDGLQTDYIHFLQEDALERFSADDKQVDWFYWCISKNIDWFSFQMGDIGRVVGVNNPKFCITPGLTVGFNIGTRYEDVPRTGHHKLYDHIRTRKGCGLSECLQLVMKNNIRAIRARTATSAGMKNVILKEKRAADKEIENNIWKRIMSPQFHITSERIRETQIYLNDNLQDIARENIEGQCTTGHSCKKSSKLLLLKLLEGTVFNLQWP